MFCIFLHNIFLFLLDCGRSIQDEVGYSAITKGDDAQINDNPWHVTLFDTIVRRF